MGTRFAHFDILAPLGRGGMGDTYIAERSGPANFRKRVCLKRVLSEHSGDPKSVAMFQNEARLAAELHHPNIVTVNEFGQEGEIWWMAQELVDGLDLRSLYAALAARGERLPLDVVLYIITEVTKALSYAHRFTPADGSAVGIIHRDVTPGNVLISNEGNVKLTDFGIAKAVKSERTQTKTVSGKFGYMPQEQMMAEPLDGRADLFSLGVMFFELLAGVRPFEGPTDAAIISHVAAGKRTDLRDLAPEVPLRIVDLVHSLTEARPEARPRTAKDVLAALAWRTPASSTADDLADIVREIKPTMSLDGNGPLTPSGVRPSHARRAAETSSPSKTNPERPASRARLATDKPETFRRRSSHPR